jgi:hypothetical protein
MFEWVEKPGVKQLETLIEKVDAAMAKVGVLYTLTTEQ